MVKLNACDEVYLQAKTFSSVRYLEDFVKISFIAFKKCTEVYQLEDNIPIICSMRQGG